MLNYGLLLVLLAAVLAGCGGSLEPYETQGGAATRLDGSKATAHALEVSEALRLHPEEPVYVRGYLLAPPDDEDTLCTRLDEDGVCRGDFLVVETSRIDLWGAPALEAGCCALGLWSPRPVVLRLRLERGRRALLLG